MRWMLIIALAAMLGGCGARLCQVVELVPDGKGGVKVTCDGEPWGVGTRFEDHRKCKEEPRGR